MAARFGQELPRENKQQEIEDAERRVANRESPNLGDAIAELLSGLLSLFGKNDGDSQAVEREASSKLTEGSEVQLGNLETTRKKVVERALQACKSGNILGAAHCTDWVSKVYGVQDVNSCPKRFSQDYVGKTGRGTGFTTKGNGIPKEQLSQIEAGDHIMIEHAPRGSGRTHSIIALETPRDGILRVASYPGGGTPPRIETYDLNHGSRGKPAFALRVHVPRQA